MNSRNYKNPTVIAWEQLRQMLTQFSDRMQRFDDMVERQGRDIGVDEVFNEIQSIRGQLDQIQSGLNLHNNTINTNRVTDMSQPEIPFIVNNKTESRNMNKKLIRLTEADIHRMVKESVNKVLNETPYDGNHGIGPLRPDSGNGDDYHMIVQELVKMLKDIQNRLGNVAVKMRKANKPQEYEKIKAIYDVIGPTLYKIRGIESGEGYDKYYYTK